MKKISIKLITIFIVGVSLLSCKDKSESKIKDESIKIDSTKAKAETELNAFEQDSEIRSITECKCFDGIGSTKTDKPVLISKFSNGNSVSVCGFFDKEMQEEGLIMSEFNIFNCETGEALVEYGAVQICRITEKKDSIIINELKYLPAGKKWAWELVQIGEQVITQNRRAITVSDLHPKLKKLEIDKNQQSEFLNSLKKGNGFGSTWETDIGKLEVLSLLGNNRAWDILKNYEEFTGEQTDGALAEQWKDAIANVEWIKGK
jgi:hypothetical protein